MYAALISEPSDCDASIKNDIFNAFDVLCRQLTLNILSGKASYDYACWLKVDDPFETVCEELHNTKSHLRYFDYFGNVLDAWGKTDGQQGDPLEVIVFCLIVHHLWGRPLNPHQQDASAVAYADDGYIKVKLSVALEILSDNKHVFKEDAGLALNVDETKIPVNENPVADARGPMLYLSWVPLMLLSSTLRRIRVRQLWRTSTSWTAYTMVSSTTSCSAFARRPASITPMATLTLANQNVLQQQHVDHKIANALLKKGTTDAHKAWNQQDRAWVDMCLHEPHEECGFRVTHNSVKLCSPNGGLSRLSPGSGCPLRAGTGHGRPGRAPGWC
jgi:hypothetical protein